MSQLTRRGQSDHAPSNSATSTVWKRPHLWLVVLIVAAMFLVPGTSKATAADPASGRVFQLQQVIDELGLKQAGRVIDVTSLDEAGRKSLFSADLTRSGFDGTYRLQIEKDGSFSVWFSAGREPRGTKIPSARSAHRGRRNQNRRRTPPTRPRPSCGRRFP